MGQIRRAQVGQIRLAKSLAERFSDAAEKVAEYAEYSVAANGGWRSIFRSYDDFQNAPLLRFAVNGFVPEGGIGINAGFVGKGKTLLMLAEEAAMLSGEPLFSEFDVPCQSRRAVYLVPEAALSPFWTRLKMFHLEDFVRSERLPVRTLSFREHVRLGDSRILRAAEGADVFLDTVVRFF